ncbi:MAG: hypothetical protein RSD62_01070 [Ruthenibacterium sp.]
MKKVLIISEYITPLQAVGSIRWTKLAKYLAKNEDCEITVLTDEKDFDKARPDGNWQRLDATLAPDRAYLAHYLSVPNGALLRWYYGRKNRRLVAALGAAAGMQGALAPQTLPVWKQALLDVVHFGKEQLLAHAAKRFLRGMTLDFDVIISTYGPAWPHLAAQWAKRRHPELCWLADYRDFCYVPGKCLIGKRYYSNFAPRHTAQADCVLLTGADMADQLRLPPRQKRVCVTNGFDPDDARPAQATDQFYLVYTGALYDAGEMKSDMRPVFRALLQLQNAGVLTPQTVQVCYAGSEKDRFLQQAQECGAQSFAQALGVLPREQALEWQKKAALLLMCTWNTPQMCDMTTAKTYEYMLAAKPILCTVSGTLAKSGPKNTIETGRLGFCYEQASDAQDFPALVAYLARAYAQWQQTGAVAYDANAQFVAQFAHPQLAHCVAQQMEKTQQA